MISILMVDKMLNYSDQGHLCLLGKTGFWTSYIYFCCYSMYILLLTSYLLSLLYFSNSFLCVDMYYANVNAKIFFILMSYPFFSQTFAFDIISWWVLQCTDLIDAMNNGYLLSFLVNVLFSVIFPYYKWLFLYFRCAYSSYILASSGEHWDYFTYLQGMIITSLLYCR